MVCCCCHRHHHLPLYLILSFPSFFSNGNSRCAIEAPHSSPLSLFCPLSLSYSSLSYSSLSYRCCHIVVPSLASFCVVNNFLIVCLFVCFFFLFLFSSCCRSTYFCSCCPCLCSCCSCYSYCSCSSSCCFCYPCLSCSFSPSSSCSSS